MGLRSEAPSKRNAHERAAGMMLAHWAAWTGAGFVSLVFVVLVYWGFVLHRNLKDEPQIVDSSDVAPETQLPLVSVVMPAKDEEEYIQRSVSSILASHYPRLELIVVNDRSRDRTADILADLSRQDTRLSLATIDHLPEGWTGKTHALFQGARRAKGDLLLFTDADTVVAPDVMIRSVQSLQKGGWGMMSLLPGFISRGFSENIVHPHLILGLGSVYQLRDVNDGGNDAGLASGSFILVRRSVYNAVGTWERFRSEITEDVALSKAVKRKGYRLAVCRGGSLVKTRGFRDVGDLCRFWKRTFYGGFEKSALKILRVTANYLVLSLLLVCLILSATVAAMGMATAPIWVTLVVSSAATMMLIGMFAAFTQKELGSWTFGLTAPVGILVSAWVALNALGVALSGRGIQWRGSSYK